MITVVGAGPAGAFYASKEKNDEVVLFEEHKSVGTPVSCTGILTDSVFRVIDRIPKDIVISKIKTFKMIAPNNSELYIDLKKTNLVLDRAGFDKYLVNKAIDSGATLKLNERFLGYRKKGKSYIVKTSKNTYEASMLVGADGPRSPVAKAAGIYGNRKFVYGYQARCRFPNLEPGVTVIHMNLGEFSWIVPEDEKIARVGVIGADNRKLLSDYRILLGRAKVIGDQSGLIPLYNPGQALRKPGEEIYLLGDAATQVKATTYGGIIYGLLAGTYLADYRQGYERAFAKKLGKDLWISLKMREYMNRMSDEDANELVKIFSKKHNNEVIAGHDRDFPSKFIVQLLMKEAKLWKIGFSLLRKKKI
jgi:digeranylgeranylglycerophospholipid reductase